MDQTTQPQHAGEPLSPLLRQVLARTADEDSYRRWERQVATTGYCSHPVRLTGGFDAADRRTGEVRPVFTTEGEPDGVLLKACGNRGASRCRSCSAVYRADTWQLVAAGLRGGKGMPESVAEHPRLFVTLTAPSFGPVHSRRLDTGGRPRSCRPHARGCCPHGRPLRCQQRHSERDPLLGSPICADCFDYEGAVLWNAVAPELWRRTTIYLGRALAGAVGLSRAALSRQVRLSFTKVAEYQARGSVHFHAVLRLDAAGPGEPTSGPPARYTAGLLARVVRQTVPQVSTPLPTARGEVSRPVGWGYQLDVRVIDAASETANPTAIAAYVAKYATKSSTELGHTLDTRLRTAEEIDALKVPEHVRRLVEACWQLGGQPHLADLQLRRWAHMLGFRGHFSTRSRRYSTTLTLLRTARADHQRATAAARHPDRTEESPVDPAAAADPDSIEIISRWRYAGSGYCTEGDRLLAASAADRHWLSWEEARLSRRTDDPDDLAMLVA